MAERELRGRCVSSRSYAKSSKYMNNLSIAVRLSYSYLHLPKPSCVQKLRAVDVSIFTFLLPQTFFLGPLDAVKHPALKVFPYLTHCYSCARITGLYCYLSYLLIFVLRMISADTTTRLLNPLLREQAWGISLPFKGTSTRSLLYLLGHSLSTHIMDLQWYP